MTRQPTLMRGGILALSGALCGVLSGIAALYVQGETLPPTDGAYGMSIFEMLADPFVRIVWLPMTFGPAFVGFMVSLWALWNVRLAKAVPLTIAVTVGAAAAAAGIFVFLSIPVAFLAAIVTMNWCRGHSAWAIPPRPLELSDLKFPARKQGL